MRVTIRHAEPEDHARIVAVVDAWWGGAVMPERRLAGCERHEEILHDRVRSRVDERAARAAAALLVDGVEQRGIGRQVQVVGPMA